VSFMCKISYLRIDTTAADTFENNIQ